MRVVRSSCCASQPFSLQQHALRGLLRFDILWFFVIRLKNPSCRACAFANLVESFLRQELDILQSTAGGGLNIIPKSIMYILSTRACHGAIKFGDALSLAECRDLVTSLSACQLPWQCAHGRPAVAPILDLRHVMDE
eukprot:m.347892 g.347892  ORF g.347892 m.347892 type:complete len:137 (-) comp55859_c0_seq2:81-491(-)